MNFEFTFFLKVPMTLCFSLVFFVGYLFKKKKKKTRKFQRPKKLDVAIVCQVIIV